METFIPLSEWAPDLPDFPGGGSAVVKNVYPKALANGTVGYGPFRGPAPLYGALADRCLGAVAYIANNGFVRMFAGDSHALYIIENGDSTWRNISNPSTYYDATSWQFTVFNGNVIAADRSITPQVCPLLGSAQFTNLSSTAPYGRFITTIKNSFVLFGDTYEPSDDSSNWNWNDRLHWSAVGNHLDWPLPGSTEAAEKQSGTVRLRGPNGQIMGLASDLVSADAVVFQRFGVQRMIYTGPPTTFAVLPVESARGCIASKSIVSSGGIVYYWGEDGIYAFDGQQSRGIGANRVDRTIYNDVDMSNIQNVSGVARESDHLIMWAYPSAQAVEGTVDKLVIYNWAIDRWSFAEVTAETIVRMITIGYTVTELQTILGYNILGDVPYSLDSRVWMRGMPYTAIFDTDHRLAFLDADPLDATIDTAELQASPGGRQLITGARPLVNGQVADQTVSIGRRRRLQDSVTWTDPVGVNALGVCPVRTSGSYIRARIFIPSSKNWADVSGLNVVPVAQGRR